MKVAYILDVFPKISETFILNEILEMQRKGVAIKVFVFASSHEDNAHFGVRQVKNVLYMQRHGFIEKCLSHMCWLFKHPILYAKTFLLAIYYNNNFLRLFVNNIPDIELILCFHPDHVHAHFGGRASNMAMMLNLLTRCPFTFTTHGYDIFRMPARNYKFKSRLSKKHITISDFNKRYIVSKFNVPENAIEVIHCGVDFSREFPESANNGENIIVSVARLEKLKGLDNLIKACVILLKNGTQFQCIIVGEGAERINLEKLINDSCLGRHVILLGNCHHDKVFDLLAKAKLMVLPSRSETMGVALMEAMAMKVPVIGPDVMGVPELIDEGVNGFRVPPDDINNLVEKINILLFDDHIRRLFIDNAYLKVYSEFNLRIETDKLLKIWKE